LTPSTLPKAIRIEPNPNNPRNSKSLTLKPQYLYLKANTLHPKLRNLDSKP